MADISGASSETLRQIAECVHVGKADAASNIPPGSQGEPGVAELVERAIADNVSPQMILHEGLMAGLRIVGKEFAAGEAFIPEVLIAARAMHIGMQKLKPLFAGQGVSSRGVFVIGTVKGDLHDIGKNLVCMMVAGAGWEVVDLGVDCTAELFAEAIANHPGCAVGLSALLTTTMVAMRDIVQTIRASNPDTVILVGGAPVNSQFASEIGASAYAVDPSAAVDALDRLIPAA